MDTLFVYTAQPSVPTPVTTEHGKVIKHPLHNYNKKFAQV